MKLRHAVAAAILAAFSIGAHAGVKVAPKLYISVTPQNSSPLGVVPNIGGMGNANVATYGYQFVAGGYVNDSIPVTFCATQTIGADAQGNPVSIYPQTITFGPQGNGGNLPGVTLPQDLPISADGCQTTYIWIATGPLSTNNYNKNIVIQVAGHDNGITLDNPNVIHIKANVTDAQPSISCFTTDSDFNFLVDCAGNLVTSGSTGTFTIVANAKRIEVSTNPGQFYYNLMYTNASGHDQTVSVSFARTGVKAHGTQAIHAMVFPSVPLLSVANFDAVNGAIPGGAADQLAPVLVPAGWTIWVDYHLEWAGIGYPVPAGLATSCATANAPLGVSATVSADGAVIGTCGAGAVGWKK